MYFPHIILCMSPPRADVVATFFPQTLDPVVDVFVLAESDTTFSEKPKPLHYDVHKSEFLEYAHKIRHVVINDLPKNGSAWENEHFQRDAAGRGLQYDPPLAPQDLVILSDADEVPDPRYVTLNQISGVVLPPRPG